MELYPRIGKNFDLKTWTNCRVGMMSWSVLILCFLVKQIESYGSLSDSMLISVVLMQIYIFKFYAYKFFFNNFPTNNKIDGNMVIGVVWTFLMTGQDITCVGDVSIGYPVSIHHLHFI